MRTIIIPKRLGYPTAEIIANGRHYTLKSGEEISVEDHIAEIIENAIRLEPKAIPSGYSKIAAVTVKAGADGTLPSTVIINKDIDGRAFRVKDFFIKMKLAHTVDGSTTGKLYLRGVVGDKADTRCSSGYCQLNGLAKDTFNNYYARFITYGKGGGGLMMVSKNSLGADNLYGVAPNFSGESTYMCPTEPSISLNEGINAIYAVMVNTENKETPFAAGCTFELWGERL